MICSEVNTQKYIEILHITFFQKNVLFLNSLSQKLQTYHTKFAAFVVLRND